MSSTKSIIKNLRNALDDGLGIVSRIWEGQARNWMTCVYAADIDGDGDIEIIASSRDGRVYCLSKTGNLRWRREIGSKAWIGTVVASSFYIPGKEAAVRIIVGTRDGKLYVLDKNGRTITRDGKTLLFDKDGKALDLQQELKAYWLSTEFVIRSVQVDPLLHSLIIVGSEDRCAYGLDYKTGELVWKFQTSGWVRTVFSCDINRDGHDEILLGSVDGNLYVLDLQGRLLSMYSIHHPVRTIFAADVDQDGNIEILVATDRKDLIVFSFGATSGFEEKWDTRFDNRLLCLCVTDIDNDGQNEIIAGSEDQHLYILDGHGDVIWRHNHKYRVLSIFPIDIDYDGTPELLLGSDNDRVRALRVRLRRGIEKKIHRYYQLLGKPDSSMLTELTTDEKALLQDILRLNTRELVTFELAKEQINEGDHDKTLSTLLRLEQQKVERLWHKDSIRYIRTVCFQHIAKEMRRKIIVGTSEGGIYAFYVNGRHAWTTILDNRIVDVQTGYIDHHKQEENVICASDNHVYFLSGAKKQQQRIAHIENTQISSICVIAPSTQSQPEIIVGSENKNLSIYSDDLQEPIATIPTEEGVRVIRAHSPIEGGMPEIVAASLGKHVYAYTRNGKLLWTYEAHDHVRSVCIKDINGDGMVEILIGSEDRNIHILDSTGHLLWRYYLPHSVLTVDAADADQDDRVEVFAGCADGNLYVFNRVGDLLWTYQTKDRIHAVRVEDIDGDGNVEIAVGSEDAFELLRVVNLQQINTMSTRCWTVMCHKSSIRDAIEAALNSKDSFLQAFALGKLAEQGDHQPRDFDTFEEYATAGAPEVRKALARLLPSLYQFNPSKVRSLLRQLSTDSDLEVRIILIEHLSALMDYDWKEGFYYLKHAVEYSSRFVRRLVVRKVHQLIDSSAETTDRRHEILAMLLAAAQDRDSEWVRQEAAHTLAHFLDMHQESLVVYVHLFIVKGLQPQIWDWIVHATTNTVVRSYINAVIPMLSGLNENNVKERLEQVVQAMDAIVSLLYGRDIRLIYAELHRLSTLETLEDIANYQCALKGGQFDSKNQFALNVLPVLENLNVVSRPLTMYFRREGLQDRLNSLLQAIEAVDRMPEYLKQQYSVSLLGEPMSSMPDYEVFHVLFKKWRRLMQVQLNELRGKAELKVELQTRDVRKEEQVGIWVTVKNTGRSSANDVKITLLYSEHFEVVGSHSFETEVIPPGEETTAEFILKPRHMLLNPEFEIIYDDADNKIKVEVFEDFVELREYDQEFRPIPNPYSTGTPVHDSNMFYGREKDIAFLKDHLTRDVKGVVVLYGQRRSGKTSILVQMCNSSALRENIPVYIDMQSVSYNMTIENFLGRVAFYIGRAMKQKNISIRIPQADDFKRDHPIHVFDVFLDQVEELLEDRKLILLIDEFEVLEEQVIKARLHPEIFEYLRDIVQHRQSINFLFSGTHKITEYTRWYRSVFFNIAIHHRLSRLSPQGAEDLIQKPVASYLEYEPLTVKKIRLLTADQPYLIHLMCRAIVDYCNERRKTYVTINDVNIVLHEVMQTGQHYFNWLWDQIKPEERIALAAIAEGGREEGRWLTLTEIEEIYRSYRISYKQWYILEALKTLMEAEIIEPEQDDTGKGALNTYRFRIPVGLIRGWLLKEHPLELVHKEVSD